MSCIPGMIDRHGVVIKRKDQGCRHILVPEFFLHSHWSVLKILEIMGVFFFSLDCRLGVS